MADFLEQLYSPVAPQQGAGNMWGGGGFTPGAQQTASYLAHNLEQVHLICL